MFASFFNDLGHTNFSRYIKNHNLLEVSNSGTPSPYAWNILEVFPFFIIGLTGGSVDPGFRVLVELFPVRAGAVQLGQQDAGGGGLQFHRRRRDLLGRTDGCGDPDHAAADVAGLCGAAAPCQRAVDWCR